MSKTKKDAIYNVNRRLDRYTDGYTPKSPRKQSNNRDEKKIKNAFRSNNITDIISIAEF